MNRSAWTLLLLLVLPISINAQVLGKFYYNKHWELTSKDSSVYIRMCVYDTTNSFFAGPVLDMYKNGKPQMKGHFMLLQKHGDFTTYYPNGQIESSGKFNEDIRDSVWHYFYPNGQEKLVVEFNQGNIKILSMKDSTGVDVIKDGNGKFRDTYHVYRKPETVFVMGDFKAYKKQGNWESYLSNGKKLYSQTFRAGVMTKGVVYPDGVKPEKNELPYDNILSLPYKYSITEKFVAGPGFNIRDYIYFLRRFDQNTSKTRMTSNDLLNDYLPEPELTHLTLNDPAITSASTGEGISAHPDVDIKVIYKEVTEELKWPAEAKKLRYQGAGRAEFTVNTDGSLADFKIESTTGYRILDEEALRALKVVALKHKWTPARVEGRAVKHTLSFPFSFQLKTH